MFPSYFKIKILVKCREYSTLGLKGTCLAWRRAPLLLIIRARNEVPRLRAAMKWRCRLYGRQCRVLWLRIAALPLRFLENFNLCLPRIFSMNGLHFYCIGLYEHWFGSRPCVSWKESSKMNGFVCIQHTALTLSVTVVTVLDNHPKLQF